ncbi:extracellular solute-binding protein [Actinomadura oligospora]|uniref:extracellular solute-binding protein n=1 Tax=Actinomadura oligospora TaxID=111804 RepID=UPI00047A1015|nr:extracellular solute-binding protein [Actinomadura oligospora]
MRSIRRTALIGAATLAEVTLTACSSSGSDAGSGSHTTITYMLPSSWANVPGFVDTVHAWEHQTGNTVALTPVPDGNYDSLVQARLAAKSGVDVFAGQDTVKNKSAVMLPASGPWVDRLNPAVRKAITSADGTIWGTPSADGLAAAGVIYNKDVFAKAGITATPTGLAELQSDLQTVKDSGVTPPVTVRRGRLDAAAAP